jgi:hypothetical protein
MRQGEVSYAAWQGMHGKGGVWHGMAHLQHGQLWEEVLRQPQPLRHLTAAHHSALAYTVSETRVKYGAACWGSSGLVTHRHGVEVEQVGRQHGAVPVDQEVRVAAQHGREGRGGGRHLCVCTVRYGMSRGGGFSFWPPNRE